MSQPYYYPWDITKIVAGWSKAPDTNHGLLLTGTDNDDVVKTFQSSDALVPSVRPKITVTYNTAPRVTDLDTIIVNEDVQKVVPMTDIFEDPDAATPDDKLFFRLDNGTALVETGIYSSENITVELRLDHNLYFTPHESERSGLDTIRVFVKDRYSNNWLERELTVRVIAVNDPPKILSIDGRPVYQDNTLEFDAHEEVPKQYFIEIKDPDNKNFFEEDVKNRSHGAAGDIEFRWEKEKTATFTINDENPEFKDLENPAYITFNPDNSLVGLFYINITVYDTYWYKPTKYSEPEKRELSNHTVMLIFNIENTNNPPEKLRILTPKPNSEYNADDLITLKGTCKDPDLQVPDSTEELTYSWLSDIDGPVGTGQEVTVELSKGKHILTLRVTDIGGETCETNITVTVRNRATIDYLNCSHHFLDDENDVLAYYYTRTDDDETFEVDRGNFPEFDIFIDIVELNSIRLKNYLIINLTVSHDLSIREDSSNYRYRFFIYLIKPNHLEVTNDLTNIRYDSRRFESIYHPEPNEYYGRFGLEDGEIVGNGRTLSIKKHLGDLENGEGIDSNLQPDFSIFATLKVELKQHPSGTFEHIICYDSAGAGAQPAPIPKQKTVVRSESGSE